MTDEPSVQRERAITPILKSESNAPAALTQSFGVAIQTTLEATTKLVSLEC